MADESSSKSKISWDIIGKIAAGVVLALFAIFIPPINKLLFPPKYLLSGKVTNEKPLPDVLISLPDDHIEDRTKRAGEFNFYPLSEGAHNITVQYNGQLYNYEVFCVGDEKIVKYDIELGIEITPLPGSDPNLKREEKSIVEPKFSKPVTESKILKKNGDNVEKLTTFRKVDSTINFVDPSQYATQNDYEPLDNPNDILSNLRLKVKIEFSDKTKGLTAFKYYIDGDDKLLDRISQVYYQRNHDSFPEYNRFFYSSTDRAEKFLFKSYQWGSIANAYVGIKLKSGKQSDIFVKEIEYMD